MCDFVSGWIAGMVGVGVGHPMDTVKVNQQTQGIGAFHCTKTIYNEFGFKGFFRGLTFPMVANGAINSVFFGVYRFTLDNLAECGLSDKPYLNSFIAGAAGGLAQLSLCCPIDLIKIKLQTEQVGSLKTGSHLGPIRLTARILASHGVTGMYQGLWPMLWRYVEPRTHLDDDGVEYNGGSFLLSQADVPSFGLYMVSYEMLSVWTKRWSRNEAVQAGGLFIAGGLAGTIAWWSILPLDVIKSRIQADDVKNSKYNGVLDCTRCIYKEQGVKGFFRGFWALSLRAFPVNGAIFITLEWLNYLCSCLIKEQMNAL